MAGWEINVPFQHKSSCTGVGDKVLSEDFVLEVKDGQRYKSYSNLPTSLPFSSVTPEMGKDREAHLSYYTSAYNRVETNQPPHDLFLSLMCYHVFISSYNVLVPNDSCCISSLCWSGSLALECFS